MPQLGMPRGKSVIHESLFIIFVALCKKLFDLQQTTIITISKIQTKKGLLMLN